MAIQKITSGIIQDGAIEAADIVSIANTQITGNIISSQITSVANTQITGNIISSQITSVANTQITGNITATNLSGGTNGTIPYQSAAGTTQMLAVGTAGQLLQTNGAGAPTWVTASAGAMTFISVQTVSGTPSEIDFTSGISATYDDYIVIFENVALSANDASHQMLFYKSGAYQEDNYRTNYIHSNSSSSQVDNAGQTNSFFLNRQTTSTGGANKRSGTVNLYNLNSATAGASSCTWAAQSCGVSATGTDNNITFGGGVEKTAAAVTRLRFRPSTGTFTSGTFRLYGIQKS